ncbi:unnamed protein product [Darwinula stevensoni]|uniref:Uncharacterized protein n=1 Tax=Darwinula stevensoni TaxID=69355 RepID=A0A7R9A5M7_9CRUS|nr:unnamed protein product [Darwinula stevensoni]CAG0895856.1 unnamed protein product [Darwinula stevensoni]
MGELLLEPGERLSFLVSSPEIGEIEEILMEWERGGAFKNPKTRRVLSQPRIIIDRVVVHTLEHRATAGFCGWGRELAPGEKMTLRRDDPGECLVQPLSRMNQILRGSLKFRP